MSHSTQRPTQRSHTAGEKRFGGSEPTDKNNRDTWRERRANAHGWPFEAPKGRGGPRDNVGQFLSEIEPDELGEDWATALQFWFGYWRRDLRPGQQRLAGGEGR